MYVQLIYDQLLDNLLHSDQLKLLFFLLLDGYSL